MLRFSGAKVGLIYACILLFACSQLAAQPLLTPWSADDLAQIESFPANQKRLGTHYFYWYDYPGQHFFDNAARTDDALQDHFPKAEAVSFNSVDWHARQLADCSAAGIDFILPVYWGVVDNYLKPSVAFSVQGLEPLQKSIARRAELGEKSPKIGLFYDTSTLLPGIRGDNQSEKYDLRTAKGKDIFYRTIRDFFYQIHPKHWAAIDGKPIVVLYGSGFAKNHDQSTIDYVYAQFAKDFHNIKPYIIKDSSWGFKCDATTQWGAALKGPNIFGKVAQVGPGYNDGAVPGRTTPIRDRENGDYYRFGWNRILNADIDLVIVETWNEMHEGTDICPSREFGRLYIDITRHYADLWKSGAKGGEDIVLEHPDLLPHPPSDKGSEYRNTSQVSFSAASSAGIYLVRGNEDGPTQDATLGGAKCIRTPEARNTYIYFAVADPFYFDLSEPIILEYTIWDDEHNWHDTQYDSYDKNATLDGAYKNTQRIFCKKSKGWVTHRIELKDARLVNRQNRGADIRFSVSGGWLAIKDVTLKKLSSVR